MYWVMDPCWESKSWSTLSVIQIQLDHQDTHIGPQKVIRVVPEEELTGVRQSKGAFYGFLLFILTLALRLGASILSTFRCGTGL